MNLENIKGVVMDMDGVLWRSYNPLPGMTDIFAFLRERDMPFALASNNAGKTQRQYTDKLAELGVDGVEERQIITSGTVTLDYLRQQYPPNIPIHVLGNPGLHDTMRNAGYELRDANVQAVVTAADFDLTYEKLKRTALIIRSGVDWIATNADATFPTPEGLAPGSGSILAALVAATDRQPLVMGKPGKPMFESALRVLGTTAEQTVMLGDRLNTDIEGAHHAGLKTILLLTGVSSREDAANHNPQPDAIYPDLPTLLNDWQ